MSSFLCELISPAASIFERNYMEKIVFLSIEENVSHKLRKIEEHFIQNPFFNVLKFILSIDISSQAFNKAETSKRHYFLRFFCFLFFNFE